MNAEAFLERLDKVRKTGTDRWLACCPAHPDKSPSLSIRELPDGRVLLYCFSGCSVESVLAAVGLEIGDLFPPRSDDPKTAPERRPFAPMDALKALSLEVGVVLIAARDMLEAGDLVLGEEGFDRLALAAERIQSGLNLVRGSGRYG
jgi:hypothetical protein